MKSASSGRLSRNVRFSRQPQELSNEDEVPAKLGNFGTGTSCGYIKRLADIDLKILTRLPGASVAYIRITYPTH